MKRAMRRIETLGEFLEVWRTLVDRVRLDVSVGRRFASDPAGTMRQYGYELGPVVRSALLQVIG